MANLASRRLLQALAGAPQLQSLALQPTPALASRLVSCLQHRSFSAPSSSPPSQQSQQSEQVNTSANGSAAQPGSSADQQASSSDSTSSTAGSTSGTAEDVKQKVYSSFKSTYDGAKSTYEDVKSKYGGSSDSGGEGSKSGPSGPAGPSVLQMIQKELRDTLLPSQDISSATKVYAGAVAVEDIPYDGPAALVVTKVQKTAWQKAWSSVEDKLGSIPLFSKLKGVKVTDTAAYKKGQELVDDLKDKYETSDHPIVHKVEDVKAKLFTGSEASRAMREIRQRDPNFDMNRFVRSIKLDAPGVTKAFLKNDLDVLRQHCGVELLEKFSGIFKHFSEQGLYEDPTILHVGEVEIVEVRQMDDDPFIIAQFHCQQLKCTRDKFGNVVDGSTDSIQRVYYFWGLQMEKSGLVTPEGKMLPPRWVIKDMLWQSLLALV